MNETREYVCVVTHGVLPRFHLRHRQFLEQSSGIFVADGGSDWAPLKGLKVDLWAGDGDSWQGAIPTTRLPHDKDVSDGEFVVRKALEKSAPTLLWWGALGGRLDMTASHLDLARSVAKERGTKIFLIDDSQFVSYLQNSKLHLNLFLHSPCAIWGAVEDRKTLVETQGLRYNLNKETLRSSSHGVSNDIESIPASIATQSGGVFISVGFTDLPLNFWTEGT